MELFWHKRFVKGWQDREQSDRLPHAVLLLGPEGTGKRLAADWIARRALGQQPLSEMPSYPSAPLEHADLSWISPPEDKDAIGIEQIRTLVSDLSLTSHAGAGKVAVIDPAHRMTANAANSLLKTLEEPPGDALLILVADRIGRLPATIFSRCQRINFAAPDRATALAWLDQLRPGASWSEALTLAGGAPLAALAALDQLESSSALGRDLNAVGRGKESPVLVAARWAKLDPAFVLDWLAREVNHAIIALSAGRAAVEQLSIDDFVLRRMDRPNLFCYLDIINRLRGQPGGSYNVQLTLEGLLIDWHDGLANCAPDIPADGMELMLASH
jgi:DNA polymerase-3 subunit delta'